MDWVASSLVMVVGKGVPLMVWMVVMVWGVVVLGSEVVEAVDDGSVVVVASWLEDAVDESVVVESVEVGDSVEVGESDEVDESVVGVAEDSVGVGDEDSETDVLVSVAVSVGVADALDPSNRSPASETSPLWPAVMATSEREYTRKEKFENRMLGRQRRKPELVGRRQGRRSRRCRSAQPSEGRWCVSNINRPALSYHPQDDNSQEKSE